MTFPAYPDPKRYRRGSASAVLVFVCITSLAVMSFLVTTKSEHVAVAEVAETGGLASVEADDGLRLRAQKMQAREIAAPELTAEMTNLPEPEESGSGQNEEHDVSQTQTDPPVAYDGDVDGDFDLAMVKVVGTDDDFTAWVQAGIAVFQVSTRSGIFLSMPDGSMRRDIDLEADPRSGLRFFHEASSALHTRLGMALRDVGVTEKMEEIDVVFTHMGLNRIRTLQDSALASTPALGNFPANTLSMTVCSRDSGLGYGEIAETTTGQKIHVNDQGC